MKKLNDKMSRRLTKENASTMIAAAATITPILASAAMIPGIRSL